MASDALSDSSLRTLSADPAASVAPIVPSAAVVDAAAATPKRPTIAQALDAGVLIVVSKASQRMQVFRKGEPWLDAPVSTGRPGHRTPAGVFPILEKRRFHRSNLYSNAPMPFMQRLTRGGIAIHAGRLPGYPASHGCIRVPFGVARALFELTSSRDTTVVIVNPPMRTADQALALALAQPASGPRPPAAPLLATAPVLQASVPVAAAPAGPARGGGQTIQLAAALSPAEAEAHWTQLVDRHAELGQFSKAIIPATVGARRVFRLRASGPGAHAWCSQRKGAGLDCFNVL